MNTLESEIKIYTPALVLDSLLSRRYRGTLVHTITWLLIFLLLVLCGYVAFDSVTHGFFDTSSLYGDARYITGLFFITLGFYGLLLQITFFYNSIYFRGLSTVHGEDFTDGSGITMEVAQICSQNQDDLTKGFLISSYGTEIMIRSGVDIDALQTFLESPRPRISIQSIQLSDDTFFTLEDVGLYLLEVDSGFKKFLFTEGVTPPLFAGANEWVWRVRALYKRNQRWWSRDALGTIRGIGREFSYGSAYTLKRFQRDINTTSAFSVFLSDTAYANEVIEKIEMTLTRNKSSNVILIGEPGVGKMDILIELGRRMREGHSIASLTAKRLVVLDTDVFVATYSSKTEFEPAFLSLMSQTERAGNIIVVIENFSAFIKSVASLDVDASELLGRFLTSSEVQIVATVDPQNYHASLEQNQQLLQYFEPVLIGVPGVESSVRVLEEASWIQEHTHNIYFTYPALVRIVESADQYITEGVMPDKAVSLLVEIASRAGQENIGIVSREFVDTSVSEKTGIPSGPVTNDEREKLLHLEDVLHRRVIGQDRAIEVIASTMRRSRAGIQSKEKPIGAFLFLGSTGVGKTETAKALAHTFFGSEETMVRFDMSEFSGEEGLTHLLGADGSVGVLSSALREHPYCVLLLDEFEKSSEAVRDLFLQIFDEGIFTDARGTKVNARNTIIIATSNAGSDLIWKYIQEGKHPDDEKEVIINAIIERRIYKPELLNRFDAVVLFEVLTESEQQTIARLMLSELQERIRKQGYELEIDDVLLEVLMKEGYSPEFGARPMRRAIQDIVEEKVALKILEGGLTPGDIIHFEKQDFE